MKTLFILSLLFFINAAAESPRYLDHHLKSDEDFVELIGKRINKVSKAASTTRDLELLRTSLLTVLSRPNKDTAQLRLIPKIKQLYGKSNFNEVLISLTNESIFALNSNKLPTKTLASYVFILENIITEIKKEAKTNSELKALLKKISKANIKITRKIKSYRLLNGMYNTVSPSKTAKSYLSSASN